MDNHDETQVIIEDTVKVKKSKLSLISFVLGIIYFIYIVSYFISGMSDADSTAAVGAGIAAMLVTPHMIATGIAVLFNALGFFMNKRGFMLVAAILYTIAMVLFPFYFMFVIIQTILSYVAYAKMK